MVGSSIYTPSDNQTTKLIAQDMLKKPKFSYVRLDRDKQEDLNPAISIADYNKGFKIFSLLHEV